MARVEECNAGELLSGIDVQFRCEPIDEVMTPQEAIEFAQELIYAGYELLQGMYSAELHTEASLMRKVRAGKKDDKLGYWQRVSPDDGERKVTTVRMVQEV